MKRQTITTLCLLLLAATSYAQVELKHGLILGGSGGSVCGAQLDVHIDQAKESLKTNYKYGAMLGYKLRIKPQHQKSFFDVDLNLGVKNVKYRATWLTDELNKGHSSNISYNHISLALSYNYKIYKGLYVGAGVEPSLYFFYPDKKDFDVPVFVKVGYEFKKVDISVSYKKGLTEMLKDENVKGGKLNDLQTQMFISF